MASTGDTYNTLLDYQAPSWAQHLQPRPSQYVQVLGTSLPVHPPTHSPHHTLSHTAQLATRPTPIHRWLLPGVPDGVQVSVKRDDMTGSLLTGNKVRKLEFLLADALQKGCDTIITCGGIQSNHSRATAVASRQLGLQPHLCLWWDGEIDPSAVGCAGNVLLDRCVGAKIMLVPHLKYSSTVVGERTIGPIVEEYSQKLRSQGAKPYIIPIGGSNEIGAWGYIQAFQEMIEQGVTEKFDDVVVAVGSGGTACGLALGNYLTGSKLKIHAVCVCDDADYFHGEIDRCLKPMGLTNSEGKPLRSRDIVDIIEGYKGRGYALSTQEELQQLLDIFSATGVSVDPVYTLKGVRGMLSELTHNPGRFAGRRVLYLHTGGVFGLYNGRMDSMLLNNHTTNQVFSYKDFIADCQ